MTCARSHDCPVEKLDADTRIVFSQAIRYFFCGDVFRIPLSVMALSGKSALGAGLGVNSPLAFHGVLEDADGISTSVSQRSSGARHPSASGRPRATTRAVRPSGPMMDDDAEAAPPRQSAVRSKKASKARVKKKPKEPKPTDRFEADTVIKSEEITTSTASAAPWKLDPD